MPTEVSAEQIKVYRTTARRRKEAKARRLSHRRDRALRVADEAATILKQQFGVERVVAFGSILSPERFHEHSDIDLAVWKLAEEHHYRAVGILLGLDPEFSVDLIRAESAPSGLLAVVERDGVIL